MQITSAVYTEDLRTPVEYPDSYDPAWRWSLANNLATMPPDECLKELLKLDDEYITTAVAVINSHMAEHQIVYESLKEMCRSGKYTDDPRVIVERARRMHEDAVNHRSCTAHYLQALLLCFNVGLEEICNRLPIDQDQVLYYEKIFYNCRTEDTWKAVKASLRRHLALEGAQSLPANADHPRYWRYTGAIHGCLLLYNEWGWCIEDGGVAMAAIAKSLQQVTLNNARRISEAGDTPRQAQAAMIDVVGRLLEAHAEGELDNDQQRIIEALSLVGPMMRPVDASDFEEITEEFTARLKELQESSKNRGEIDGNAKNDHMRQQLRVVGEDDE